MTEVINDSNGKHYVAVNYKAPEYVDLQPDKVTASTFIDLLKELEEKESEISNDINDLVVHDCPNYVMCTKFVGCSEH